MSAGRTVAEGRTWGNFANHDPTFEARCRCIDDNGIALSICRFWSDLTTNCQRDPQVECGADPVEVCFPCGPYCTCLPTDNAVTGNEMTYDQCVAECVGVNMRMPGNQAELDDGASTGCGTNSQRMWVSACVVGERMVNDVCVSCNLAEAETYQNAVAATPQTCGVSTCRNGFDPSADHSACVCEGATKYMNATGDCAECDAGSAVSPTDITECVCSGTGTTWDAASNTCTCATAGQHVNAAGDCAECDAGSAVSPTDITECVCSGTGTTWDAASNTCTCATAGQYINAANDCAECGAGSTVNPVDITECVCSFFLPGTTWDAVSNTCGSAPTSPPPTAPPATVSPPTTSAPTSYETPPSPTEYRLTCGPHTVGNTNQTRCCAVAEGVQAYRDDCSVESCLQTHVWREDSSACVVYTTPESNEIGWILAFLVAGLLLLSLCAALAALYARRRRQRQTPKGHTDISSPRGALAETHEEYVRPLQEEHRNHSYQRSHTTLAYSRGTSTGNVNMSSLPATQSETHAEYAPPLHEEHRNHSYQPSHTTLPYSRRQERGSSALASVVFHAPQTSAASDDRLKPSPSQPVPTSRPNYESAYNPYPEIGNDLQHEQQQVPMSHAESLHHLQLRGPPSGPNSNPSFHPRPPLGPYDDPQHVHGTAAAHLQDLV